MGDEKAMAISSPPSVQIDIDVGIIATKQEDEHKETEVFGEEGEGQVNFRTVGWVRAAMFLVKQTFATGVLSIPSAMYYMGAVAGCVSIVVWGIVNTYLAYVQGKFKLAHPKMHTIVDATEIAAFDLSGGSKAWARFSRWLTEVLSFSVIGL